MDEVIIGIVADTHVPDRVANLHPGLVPGLTAAGVQRIFHAGDICTPSVLEELSYVAPVLAVQGNRDLLNGNRQPMTQSQEVLGIKIGLMHGYGSWRLYFVEKFFMLLHGYQLSYYEKLGLQTFPNVDILIFGHTHKPENVRLSGRLIFNPGSAGIGGWGYPPSYGIIQIRSDGSIQAKIIELSGARRENGEWRSVN